MGGVGRRRKRLVILTGKSIQLQRKIDENTKIKYSKAKKIKNLERKLNSRTIMYF